MTQLIREYSMADYARHYNCHHPHLGLQQEHPLHRSGSIVDIIARIERGQILGSVASEKLLVRG